MRLHFEKLSRFDRAAEPCSVAVPFPCGMLGDASRFVVHDGGRPIPTQCRVTAMWPDGSVKWLLVHFLADLPGNEEKDFECRWGQEPPPVPAEPVAAETSGAEVVVRTGDLRVSLGAHEASGLLGGIRYRDLQVNGAEMEGPWVVSARGERWTAAPGVEGWRVIEAGPVRVVVETRGKHVGGDRSEFLDFTARVYAFAGKPWIHLAYQFMHREPAKQLELRQIATAWRPQPSASGEVRTALATSNYGSRIREGAPGQELRHLIDAEQLVYESNEQVPETLYGTFWADWNDPQSGGLCVTIHQAQQNFPKALAVDRSHLEASLLPAESGGLTLIQGMAKTHRLMLHFHGPEVGLDELNIRSLQFQMPDRPVLEPDVYRAAGVLEEVWVAEPVPRVERLLIDLADNRTRGYGMLNWGDGPDAGYTNQGRGRGELVWTNNEYDLPHAALLMYARSGERRMLDYLLVAAEHWMDVDVCHYSEDPLRYRGQVVHSARHVTGGVTVSHEWVEGLLDYYHQTGEEFAYETALGIGENVVRQLERPALRRPAGSSARETGWGLRTLVALYVETHDERWLEPAQFIVEQFEAWQAEYGAWLAPYTDHTLVRVPFMIAVAANSLMRYYRIRPEKRVGDMIVAAMRDLVEHCLGPDGRFYYKELPSLQRRGAGALVLEALAHAYEISGDARFLEAGRPTFELLLQGDWSRRGYSGPKFIAGDAVVLPGGSGPKAFAAFLAPALPFYRAATQAGMLR